MQQVFVVREPNTNPLVICGTYSQLRAEALCEHLRAMPFLPYPGHPRPPQYRVLGHEAVKKCLAEKARRTATTLRAAGC